MVNETLGAHLRNLITPYKNAIVMLKNANINLVALDLEKNLNEIIEFSQSDKMESINWRDE